MQNHSKVWTKVNGLSSTLRRLVGLIFSFSTANMGNLLTNDSSFPLDLFGLSSMLFRAKQYREAVIHLVDTSYPKACPEDDLKRFSSGHFSEQLWSLVREWGLSERHNVSKQYHKQASGPENNMPTEQKWFYAGLTSQWFCQMILRRYACENNIFRFFGLV